MCLTFGARDAKSRLSEYFIGLLSLGKRFCNGPLSALAQTSNIPFVSFHCL